MSTEPVKKPAETSRVVRNHDSALTPQAAIAWALIAHEMPDGEVWTVQQQAARVIDLLADNGYEIHRAKPIPQCKAMFCIHPAHEPDMRHSDVTGHSWDEDTSDYKGEVIAHIISTEG